MANSTREITGEELQLFKNINIQLESFIFAVDAVAFVTSDNIPIDSISTSDLAKILSGEQDNWQFLANRNQPINIYGRQSNSRTFEYVKEKLQIQFSPYVKQMNGNAQILEALKVDDPGIGYVGAGYVLGDNLKGLKILKIYSGKEAAISPLDAQQISLGKYEFQRPLYQYYIAHEYQKVKPFIDFEKSTEGQHIIKKSGYYVVAYEIAPEESK